MYILTLLYIPLDALLPLLRCSPRKKSNSISYLGGVILQWSQYRVVLNNKAEAINIATDIYVQI